MKKRVSYKRPDGIGRAQSRNARVNGKPIFSQDPGYFTFMFGMIMFGAGMYLLLRYAL